MRIIRPKQAADKCGWSLATTWRKAKADPDHPKPVKVSDGVTGFIEVEIDAYLERRVAEARAAPVRKESIAKAAKKSAEIRAASQGAR